MNPAVNSIQQQFLTSQRKTNKTDFSPLHKISLCAQPISLYSVCENRNLSSQVRPGQDEAELLRALLAKKGHVRPAHLPTPDRVPCALQIYVMQYCHLLWKHRPLLASMCCTKLCQLKKKKKRISFSRPQLSIW